MNEFFYNLMYIRPEKAYLRSAKILLFKTHLRSSRIDSKEVFHLIKERLLSKGKMELSGRTEGLVMSHLEYAFILEKFN